MKIVGLPKSAYSSEEIFEAELEALFRNRIEYIGANSSLSSGNVFVPVERLNNEWLLAQHQSGLRLVKNRCRHRNAKLVNEVTLGCRVKCKIHGWAYDEMGNCVSAPMMNAGIPGERDLERREVFRWGDLLFTNAEFGDFRNGLSSLAPFQFANIDQKVFHKSYIEFYSYNWKYYIELFEENYHVPFIHPGFTKFVDLNSLKWHEHKQFMAQTFMPNRNLFLLGNSSAGEKYDRWISLLSQKCKGRLPDYACVMINWYPNFIIEVFPFCMSISTIHPTGPNQFSFITDYYHDADVMESHPDLCMAAEAALEETESEDLQFSESFVEGSKSNGLLNEGAPEIEIHQDLEYGLYGFYRFYREKMSAR